MGQRVEPIYPEKVASAMGIDEVAVVDAFDAEAIAQTLQAAFNKKGLSFIVARGRCPYIENKRCQVTSRISENGKDPP